MKLSPVPSVSMDPHAYFPSTWRQPIGKLLTNRRITELALEGRYGKNAQLAAHAKTLVRRDGIVYRCEARGCSEAIGVRFLRWSYLPKAGYYCPRHVKLFRDEAAKNKEREKALREALNQGFAYE